MARKPKEKVEKVCEVCGKTFLTKYPERQRYCPGSRCRSEAYNRTHRVEDREAFAREAVRAYWRRTKKAWRAKRAAA